MTATAYNNIFSNPYTTVFNIINTRSNIADPRDNTGARKFVHNTEPFSKAFDFSEYPYIYVKYPTITFSNESADRKKKIIRWLQVIFVRIVKDGAGQSRVDSGITDMETICNSMIQTFNKTSVVDTINGGRLFKPTLNLVNTDSAVIDEQDIHEIEFELTYETRITVNS